MFGNTVQTLAQFQTTVEGWLGNTWTTAKNVFGTTVRTATEWWNHTTTSLTSISNSIWKWLNDLGNNARGWIHAIGDWLNSVFPSGVGGQQAETTRTGANVLAAIWAGISNTVAGSVLGPLAEALGHIPLVGPTIASAITALAGQIPHYQAYTGSTGDNPKPGGGTGGGNIDVNQYDIIDVDRLYFNSDDGIQDDTDTPHMSTHTYTGTDSANKRGFTFMIPLRGEYNFVVRDNSDGINNHPRQLMTIRLPQQGDVLGSIKIGLPESNIASIQGTGTNIRETVSLQGRIGIGAAATEKVGFFGKAPAAKYTTDVRRLTAPSAVTTLAVYARLSNLVTQFNRVVTALGQYGLIDIV